MLSCRSCSVGQARPAVGDGDERTAAAHQLPGHDDLGLLGRKRGGVLQQLGQQVHGVGRGVPADRDILLDVQGDPVVLLDLGQRGPEHVHQGEWPGRIARRLVTGQDAARCPSAAAAG